MAETQSKLSITAEEAVHLIAAQATFIDVRSQGEFAKGSLPGAYSSPILNDAERKQVGILYKDKGQAAAIQLGHQLVQGDTKASRIEHWQQLAAEHQVSALFCWRGGLRSQLATSWLAEAGLALPSINKGYKAVRTQLLEVLTSQPAKLNICLLGGQTGVGKTDVLERTAAYINLEALAHHRGSAFGGYTSPQPTSIQFEHRLAKALLQQSLETLVVLEDEGRRIGQLGLPDALYQAMQTADLVVLEAPLEQRVERIFQSYIIEGLQAYQLQDADQGEANFCSALFDALFRIRKRLGGVHYQRLKERMQSAFNTQTQTSAMDGHKHWIEGLLKHYYDPMYDYQLKQKTERIRFHGQAEAVLNYLQSRL